jgi:2,4-dienoyl-CoA reductase-like NADH-dependent reductase (Old Yellow Enzyme family)
MTSPLLTPLELAPGLVARNRAWLAPMTNLQSHADGTLSDAEHDWLARRAEGGFGVIETCAAFVAQDGKAWAGELGIENDTHAPGLARLARTLRGHGALGVVQLFHGGARAPSKVTGAVPWSASTWREETPGFEPPRPATEDDLRRVIEAFRAGAARAHRAGFAGVELHGAHGYLLSQFLSRTMNPRDDGWGGDLAGRARLLRECTRAVRAAVPDGFAVGVRLSPEDFGQARGLDLDESLEVAAWLAQDGVDFLHLSLWDAEKNTHKRPEAHPVPLFRQAVPARVRLVAAGGVWTRAQAEALLDRGADFVALGRAAVGNPDWARRVVDPWWVPARPPYSVDDLAAVAVSRPFAEYLRRWKGFVAE